MVLLMTKTIKIGQTTDRCFCKSYFFELFGFKNVLINENWIGPNSHVSESLVYL